MDAEFRIYNHDFTIFKIYIIKQEILYVKRRNFFMNTNKKTVIKIGLVSILLLITYFIFMNTYHLFFLKSTFAYEHTNFLKRIIPFICAVIVFLIGKDSLNKKDATFLKIAYLTILIAEISFTLNKTILGIVFFGLCQIFLIMRHSAGISNSVKENKKFFLLLGIVIITIVFILIATIFYPALGMGTLFYSIIIYGTILGISLWIGISNYYIGHFPKKNALFIMIGIIFFFIGDFLVGIEIITEDIYIKNILNLFLWIFYTPAVTLLALSGYNYSANSKI